MKKSILYIFTFAFIISSNFSCKPEAKPIDPQPTSSTASEEVESIPGFVHGVYFWLKKDNPELVDEFIKEGLPKLAAVPSIQSVSWGPPAGTPRDVVDNSYDLAWIVTFKSAEDQDKYQVDPIHLEFVEKYKSIFDHVQVYDNLVTNYRAK